MIPAKMEVLKDLISQMQQLMTEGHGDDAEAGKEAMEELGDAKDAPKEMAEECEEGDDDLRASVREAFKGKPKAPPAKGAMVVMQERISAPAPKKEFPARKGKKGLNYG